MRDNELDIENASSIWFCVLFELHSVSLVHSQEEPIKNNTP